MKRIRRQEETIRRTGHLLVVIRSVFIGSMRHALLIGCLLASACVASDDAVTNSTDFDVATSTSTTEVSRSSTSSPVLDPNAAVEPVDPSEIHGIWVTVMQYYVQFNPDGTWKVNPEPNKPYPFAYGTYEFDGVRLAMTTNVDAMDCAGADAEYVLIFSEERSEIDVQIPTARDECPTRRGDFWGGFTRYASDESDE